MISYGRASAALGLLHEHVLGQREHDRARATGSRDVERTRDELGDPVGAVDLRHPLRHRAEHVAVVDLLERLAPHHLARDLADQEDQRRRVLERGVDAAGRVRRSGASRDHADPRAAGQLAVGVGHVGGADLVAAGDEADRGVVEGVEHGQIALAGNAVGHVHPVHHELVDEEPAAAPHVRRKPVLEVDGWLLQLREIVVGGVDVADRALARPLGGEDHDADERRRLVPRGLRQHRVGAGLEPRAARPVRGRVALGVDVDLAMEQEANPRPGMRVPVRDAARRKVDPVAAHDPLGERVELDPAGEERTIGLVGGVVELPDERVPLDVRLAVEGRVVRDVVDDAMPAGRLGAGLELVEGEPHRATLARATRRSTPDEQGSRLDPEPREAAIGTDAIAAAKRRWRHG